VVVADEFAPDRVRILFLTVLGADGSSEPASVPVQQLIIAGWAGRDMAAVQEHVRELEELGVKAPSTIPVFYRAGIETLTTDDRIQVIGPDSSGEVEAIFIERGGELLVGVGSDHTDRRAEAYSIAVSKQMCPKPVSPEVWRYADVANHWDSLILRSYAVIDGERHLYQEGTVAGLQPPEALFAKVGAEGTLPAATAMYGGTMSAIGGIRPMQSMELILEDPYLKRSLRHSYTIAVLPIVS
jgi:hypothetical protein